MTRKLLPHGISFVNTQLAEHSDGEVPLSRWNEIKDQAINELWFQNRFFRKQRDSEVERATALDKRASKRAKRRKSNQPREKERFCLISRNKNGHF